MGRYRLLVTLVMFSTLLLVAQPQAPLTNEDLMKMVKAGFDEGTIVQAIKTNGSAVDTSVQSLVELKSAGVSESIIRVLLTARPAASEQQAVAGKPAEEAEEIGVYLNREGKFVMVEPEIVTWRTGGVLKTIATGGLTRGHINGKVSNPHSRLQLSAPLEFLIVCADGTSAAEYQLLNLEEKKDRREFRAMTGGIVHASGGADKNVVEFEFERIRPRTYKIQVRQLDKGEYGFLPPGAALSASAASMGKIYTFGLE